MGPLSWERFLECVREFVKVSNYYNDGWELKSITEEPKIGESYLVKRDVKESKKRNPKKGKEENSNYEQPMEDGSEVDAKTKKLFIWEYHILYSASYSVPVLYFNISETDGRRLSYEETLSNLSIEDRLVSRLGTTISQVEHPLLRKPFYYMHPCQTSELLVAPKYNLLVTWLSCVAPVVNLSVGIKYAIGLETNHTIPAKFDDSDVDMDLYDYDDLPLKN